MVSINFKGKQYVQNYHLAVKYHEFVPDKKKSLTEKISLHDNLIIHGDNLKALKSLLPTHAGKIKCIYIDPPYNTGNEKWVYNDNVNSPMMQEWLGKVVDKEDLTRHDKWLCLMWPRLRLLRELLADDGVIFVSIDDNEAHRLREAMDEIFGEENFVANFVWKRRSSSALAEKFVSSDHEHVVCYQKGNFDGFKGAAKDYASYSNPDNDPKGDWMVDNPTVGMTREQRPNQFYDLVDPKTGNVFSANPNRVWAYIPETMNEMIKAGRVVFPKDSSKRPMIKRYKKDLKRDVNPISTWMNGIAKRDGDDCAPHLNVGLNSESTKLLQTIFGSNVFNYSKPLSLVRELLKNATDSDSIILDSFAGSGTTAHAVLDLNKEDGGNRKFILVEMENYADEITAERLRRVINGVPSAKDEKLQKGLGGTFSYFELGNAIEMQKILTGEILPSFLDLARYVFFTSTGEILEESKVDENKFFIGESRSHSVYMIYQPDVTFLKANALTLDRVRAFQDNNGKRRMVFAPTKYLDQEHLDQYCIDFAQLPFEIYKLIK
jgi:adenine-specific DNA-methyltransferase